MKLFLIKCNLCWNNVYRSRGRINESGKFGWRVYCSIKCQSKVRNKQALLICARRGCNASFKRLQSDLRRVKNSYCSNSCSAIINNSKRPRKKKVCANIDCNVEFYGRNKYCSPKCIQLPQSKYTKDVTIGLIQSFFQEKGRLPFKQELIKIYKPVRKHFGTWNNAIKAAGFKPNPATFAKKHIAKDGHKCDSLAEKIIDDWLYARKIEHKTDVSYSGNGGFTADFKVGKYWIEFFGLSGEHKKYDELKERKLKLVIKYDLKLIDIYPYHLLSKNFLGEKLGGLVS